MKRSFILLFVTFVLSFLMISLPLCGAYANTSFNAGNIYIVYDSNGKQLFESDNVQVGDKIITPDLKEYEVIEIDDNNHVGRAEYNGRYEKPTIYKDKSNLRFNNNIKKSVGLYMTHNDESYVPTDNTESIYGAGGIHDVAKELRQDFANLGYEVYLDETLHIPHNSSAYSRSAVTAQNLLKNNLDAIFDIHRDGASRSLYVKNIEGKERCKIRIVVGQKNPNYEVNLQFAMYLMSVAQEYCPWLFLDIYYAKGHYNQALSNKALLFEMGSHLVEKELVLSSAKELAKVVDKTLFSTIVQDDNSLLITNEVQKEDETLVTNVLDNTIQEPRFESAYKDNIINFSCAFVALCGVIAISSYSRHLYISRQNNKKVTPKQKK